MMVKPPTPVAPEPSPGICFTANSKIFLEKFSASPLKMPPMAMPMMPLKVFITASAYMLMQPPMMSPQVMPTSTPLTVLGRGRERLAGPPQPMASSTGT